MLYPLSYEGRAGAIVGVRANRAPPAFDAEHGDATGCSTFAG
jgi:hypothetical protein